MIGQAIAIDSSAIVSIAFHESEAERFARIIAENHCFIGWPTLLEINLVLSARLGQAGLMTLHTIMANSDLTFVDFDEVAFKWAAYAYQNFGKNRHPAGLNYGDCLSYAIARTLDVPLLFKGQDFIHTDVKQINEVIR